jgi:hypothetical protein
MAAETRAPGVPFLAMSASVLMASGACLRASSWMLLAALGGYEVGGRQISVWPCIQWAFDLSGIVAFAGTQYEARMEVSSQGRRGRRVRNTCRTDSL